MKPNSFTLMRIQNGKYRSFKANIWFNSHNSRRVTRRCNKITVYVAMTQFTINNLGKNILLFFLTNPGILLPISEVLAMAFKSETHESNQSFKLHFSSST
jgi:hypothetical protein